MSLFIIFTTLLPFITITIPPPLSSSSSLFVSICSSLAIVFGLAPYPASAAAPTASSSVVEMESNDDILLVSSSSSNCQYNNEDEDENNHRQCHTSNQKDFGHGEVEQDEEPVQQQHAKTQEQLQNISKSAKKEEKEKTKSMTNTNEKTKRTKKKTKTKVHKLTKQNGLKCNVYLAQSTIEGGGLGIFTSIPHTKGLRIAGIADIVIHLIDIPSNAAGLQLLLKEYAWSGSLTYGQYEGKYRVEGVIPGIGMAANGLESEYSNVKLYKPSVDEADLPRTTSPGAGAITHYHNLTFYATRDIKAGDELFINYGSSWFKERNVDGNDDNDNGSSHRQHRRQRSVGWLMSNGMCLDNLFAKQKSTKRNAGRGAFANRYIPKGALVAPAPLIHIVPKQSLNTYNPKSNSKQLLMNYVIGHPKSPVLLYPYGGGLVNLINHDAKAPNAELRWSNHEFHQSDWLSLTPMELALTKTKGTGLMMDVVALRDIEPGEEVLLNYGKHWEDAWNAHVKAWKAPEGAESYAPAYVMNDVATKLRTQEEQDLYPYPDNLQIVCYYSYYETMMLQKQKNNYYVDEDNKKKKKEVIMYKWKPTKSTLKPTNLRPCTILTREEDTLHGRGFRYTVLMKNRPKSFIDTTVSTKTNKNKERIPDDEIKKRHIVQHVPRVAIQFVDKPGTTDQHLKNAFRHYIGFPDGHGKGGGVTEDKEEEEEGDDDHLSLFPKAWIIKSNDDIHEAANQE